MNKRGKVILLPTQGKISEGSIIMFNNLLGRVINYTSSRAVVILERLEESIEVPSKAIHLMKYFIMNNKNVIIGELSYNDYNKVADGDTVRYTITSIKRKAELGDQVKLFRLGASDSSNTSNLIQYAQDNGKKHIDGVIVGAKGNTYQVKVLGGEFPIVSTRRNFFAIKPLDTKNICFYISTVKGKETKNVATKTKHR